MKIKINRFPVAKCSFWLLLMFCITAHAGKSDAQLQIDKDVWVPLLAASNSFDAEGFLAVQSKDIVRVPMDSKEVYGLARYQKEIREGFKRARERGIVRKSDMRFMDRRASEDLAYETGYFRSEVRLPGGEERIRYSRFEMVLRKEEGKWKILIDKDTADNGKITEEVFRSGETMKYSPVKP